MTKIIESIPNISEGRNQKIIEKCVDQIRSTPGCTVLDYSSDASHNRSVITYIGSPRACEEASVKLAAETVKLIDLNKHCGEHPRIGCVDVMPFVPIRDVKMDECIALSQRVGKKIAEETGMAVYLYEQSASAPYRSNLAEVRKGQFEGLGEKVKDPAWIPDYGGQNYHPTGGAVAVGARTPLIAYNINLDTDNMEIANKISRIIRESGGGLSHVKAMGVYIKERNMAQVSINMTDYTITPLHRVTEFVRREAARYGAHIVGTELIGLAPMKAFIDAAEYYLQLENFNFKTKILENHLL